MYLWGRAPSAHIRLRPNIYGKILSSAFLRMEQRIFTDHKQHFLFPLRCLSIALICQSNKCILKHERSILHKEFEQKLNNS